ncbi:tannase/feruloyl esterase family alpha/beta hydrolase [Gammaproteobacteria bacterium]|nr:tannase/feruloyl esterase family alpha/beta hydrolase [Gammaproteobacteria bacterium]
MKKFLLVTGMAVFLVVFSGYFAFTQFQSQLWPEQPNVLSIPNTRCTLTTFSDLPEVQLLTASLEDSQADHCMITGRIEKEINFELLLPQDWNGKFVMGGGGGFVGSVVNTAWFYGAVKSGYATVGTDTGHVGHAIDAGWALNNPRRIENFGHRAVHLTAVAAKSLIENYYSQPSAKNYFMGCSRGGGQGLMEAQRYPEDFDGIVAGAPAYNWQAIAAHGIQINQKMFPDPNFLDEAIIGQAEQALIAQHYLEQCDHLDGIEDGILTDPRDCDFQVESLRCTGPYNGSCLDADQLSAIKTVYDGPRDDLGQLYPGFPLGGETGDAGMKVWTTGGLVHNPDISEPFDADGPAAPLMPNALYGFSTGLMKNMVFNDPEWSYVDYDFVGYRDDSANIVELLNATNPDISAFRERGGKLLMYHGWADMGLSALGTIKYFDEVLEQDETARDDVRLYLMPGMDHCFGGAGPSLVNYLTELDRWVMSSTPPESIEATWMRFGAVPFGSRMVCPYPQRPVYDGMGDTDKASSFKCALPE